MFRWLGRWWRSWRLSRLIERVRSYKMSPEEREAQRRSFAYGNAKLSNPRVTREMVDQAAEAPNGKDGG